ncbi:cupin domain-containing protein [Burkholderia cenocepacia]|uniref:cupin domain-containing protein n=1 Tax=Burkholderia cenocepacia TaxID=95486 RepID=UPI002AB63996|nr:cupin domain-containing protein [Burkholderia cenocepacia]
MKIANPVNSEVRTDDHPTGVLGFRYLLEGKENTPENFVMLIAENLGHFEMVQHRHNFDQFRFTLSGQMNLGRGRVLREGDLCYFPEGTSYGPQDDPAGPVVLVVQFGGASGYGYMSSSQYLEGRESLKQTGRFEGPVFIREENGRTIKKFSINAIWEKSMGQRMLIPAPRYDDVIIMKPAAYRWTPVRPDQGVFRKLLGSFTERGTTAEMIKVTQGATFNIAAVNAIRLFFVREGSGRLNGELLEQHFGAQVEPGETGVLSANSDIELLVFTMPMLGEDWLDAQLPSVETQPGESVRDPA